MFDLHDPKQAYEIFRLQWMIDHGYSVLDLLNNLEAIIEEDQNESGVRTSLESLFLDWEFGIGFDGSIWPCYEGNPTSRQTANEYAANFRLRGTDLL